MPQWIRRVRGALGTGVTWGVAWAVAGVMIGVSSLILPGLPWAAFFKVFDAPLPALAVPGFLCGVTFSLIFGVFARRYRVDELSIAQTAAWGGIGGMLLGGTIVAFGFPFGGMVFTTLLSAGCAAGSLAIARRGARQELLEVPNRDSDQSSLGAGSTKQIERG